MDSTLEAGLYVARGLVQADLNMKNAVTDTVIGTANLALSGVNNHIRAFNLVAGTNCPTLKIPAPDWSRGLAIEEGGEPGSWSDTHGWSKFSAGVGLDAALTAAGWPVREPEIPG